MWTAKQLIREVRSIAAARSEAKYNAGSGFGGCFYNSKSCSDGVGFGCIFGQAARALGTEIKDIHNGVDSNTIDNMIKLMQVRASKKQISWMKCVQGSQDSGLSWGESVKRADEEC